MLAVLFLVLGLIGGYVHWTYERRTFWYFGPLMFTLTLALIYYMNFKYGWSQSPELGENVQREVRDRDYFYIWQSVAQILDREPTDKPDRAGYASRRAWLLATPLLLIACVPLAANWRVASHRGETFTADW